METLQSWALCLVLSTAGAAMVHLLSPKGATEKAMRVMIALFLLSAILSPFLSGDGLKLELEGQAMADPQGQVNAVVERMNQALMEQARAEVEEETRQSLAAMGVTQTEIQVDMDITEESLISITEIKIWLPETAQEDAPRIKEELEQSLGCPVSLVWDEAVTQ